MRRLILFLGLTLCLGGGGWLSLTRMEREAVYPFDATRIPPAATGLTGVTEVKLSSLGQTLVLWIAPPREGKPTILYFHGNAGNLANRAGRFGKFTGRGYGLIAPAYRGSSGSTGRPSETTLTRDALKVYGKLDTLVAGLSPAELVVYGESLGAAVALKLLATPDLQPPAGVVLEAPFTSLPDVVLHNSPQLEPLISRMKNVWNSRLHARSLSAPLLVLHGTEDALIPTDQGRQVFTTAPSKQKRFLAITGAGHSDTWRTDSLPVLWRFIDSLGRP